MSVTAYASSETVDQNGTTLYVIRHGEAVGNREGKFLGQVNPPLTQTGRDQARRMGHTLVDTGLTHIICSDLIRAFETASIVGEILKLPVHSTPALREVNHGIIDGWTSDAVLASTYGQDRERDKYNYRPPQGESYADIETRILTALSTLGDKTLIVTHMGPLRVLLHRMCGYPTNKAAGTHIGHDQILRLQCQNAVWSGAISAHGDQAG